MTEVRVLTYSLDHYDPIGYTGDKHQYEDTEVANRFELVPDIIKETGADVVLLQSIYGGNETQAEFGLRTLAQETNMQCSVKGVPTAAKSQHDELATGIMWNERFKPREWFPQRDYWRPLSCVSGTMDGVEVTYVSGHDMSVDQIEGANADLRVPEALRTAAFANRHTNVLIAKDCNGLSGARQSNGTYFDPDPALKVLLNRGMSDSDRAFILDRKPGQALEHGGLVDIAAQLAMQQGLARECTTGGRPMREGEQRYDRFYARPEIAALARSVSVIRNARTAVASNHYPTLLVYDLP